MTFDMCHAQLYCKSCEKDLAEYARRVKPFVSHLHISDATGVGGEGVQIHEGEIDFSRVFSCEKDLAEYVALVRSVANHALCQYQ